MTREEMNKVFHKMLSETDLSVRGNMTAQMCEACRMAIRLNKAWDKVVEKITKLRDCWEKDCYHDEADALTTALKIILGEVKNEQT